MLPNTYEPKKPLVVLLLDRRKGGGIAKQKKESSESERRPDERWGGGARYPGKKTKTKVSWRELELLKEGRGASHAKGLTKRVTRRGRNAPAGGGGNYKRKSLYDKGKSLFLQRPSAARVPLGGKAATSA